MSYFASNRGQLDLTVKEEEEDTGIRECQIGAYWAAKSHFTARDEEPALVSLPTGAGKTAVMMLLSFGLEAERILVVSPSDVLRSQTAKKFRQLDGLVQSNTVEEEIEKPTVEKITERVTSEGEWEDFSDADVIVALPNNISTVYNREDLDDIVLPPEDFFDVVFFDEAHHARAPSWSKLLKEFEGARQILLTATPFRRDRRSLPGRLVYHYPLPKAIETGIYQPVDLHPAGQSEDADRDEQLGQTASEALSSIRAEYPAARMLIRTNRIDKTEGLEAIYSDLGLDVETVHSQRTPRQNEQTLERLREGELDGIIAVGKLGEGLDITHLKVAVLHHPPKSFPFTVQLVGRIARPLEQSDVEAAVVASPDQMREEGVADMVRQLYMEDRAWKNLIPDLVDRFIEHEHPDMMAGSSKTLAGVDPGDLRPYLSTRLYRVTDSQLRFGADLDIDNVEALYPLPQVSGRQFAGFITEKIDRPSWAKRTILFHSAFDLHLFYHHEASDTLFEFTTSDETASQIRNQIVEGGYMRRGGEELVRVMHSSSVMEYLVAGLDNAVGPSGALPSYKMLLGDRVEGAINPSDSRVFVRGHALARVGDDETRGISDQQGRVWSMGRKSISEFINWCDTIGDLLISNTGVDQAKGLEFLGSPEPRDVFPSTPFRIGLDPELVRYAVQVREDDEATWREVDQGYMEPLTDAEGQEELDLEFFPSPDVAPIECTYSLEEDEWTGDLPEYQFRVDSGETYEEMSGEEFFKRYPPYFYLGNGELIVAGQSMNTSPEYDQLPETCYIEDLDWEECDVKVEYEIDAENKTVETEGDLDSVHEWMESRFSSGDDENRIVFKDHGSQEIADYIEIIPESELVKFYHCKSAPTNGDGDEKIGATLGHVKDVIDQVLRSNMWISNSRLMDRVDGRDTRDNNTHFLGERENFDLGGREEFEDVRGNFSPAEWDYEVVIVNPGLQYSEISDSENVNLTLLTCFEWLKGIGSELRIMGHSGE